MKYAALGGFLLFWAASVEIGLLPRVIVPSPVSVAIEWWQHLFQISYWQDIYASVYRVVVAFLLSALLAVPTALMMTESRTARALVSPVVDFVRYLPVPTLIPLVILFFGIGEFSKITLLFIGTYFQLVLLLLDDFDLTPREYHDLFLTLGFTRWKRTVFLFRATAHQIYDNCRITVGWCWTYVVIAELVASNDGIGHFIKEAQRFSNIEAVFIGIFTMGLIGFLTDASFKLGYAKIFGYLETNK